MPPLLAASLIVFLEGLSFGVILPVLPAYVRQLGVAESWAGDADWQGFKLWAGVMFAAATLPRVFMAPMWGRLSDRIGRRPTIAIVAVGTMAASAMWGLSAPLDGVLMSGLLWLLASRILYGLFAAQSVLSMAVASDVSTTAKRAAAMGAIGAAFGVAFTIGPVVGGYFAEHVGRDELGYLAASFQCIGLLIALFALRETRPTAAPMDGPDEVFVKPTKMLHLAAVPVVTAMMIVTITSTAAYSVLFPTLQPLAHDRHGWSESDVGIALSIFGLIGAFVQGGAIRPMVRRYGEKPVAMLGLALLAAGLVWIAEERSVWQFWGSLSLMAIGTGFCVPAVTGMMSISVDQRDQGAVHGLNQSATSIGRTLGFALSGVLFMTLGSAGAYLTAAGMAVVAIGVGATVKLKAHDADAAPDRMIEATADEAP